MGTLCVVAAAFALQSGFFVLQVHAVEEGTTVTEEIATVGRALTRAGMIFPLLIGISARLAALVPTVFLGVIGIFVFVAFSKKALLISLLALFISYLDKHKRMRPKIIHVHSEGHHHPEIGAMEFEVPSYYPPHSHHSHVGHKFFDHFHHKKHFRKWPKIDNMAWSTAGPSIETSLDSYLPHSARRVDDTYPYHIFFAPHNSTEEVVVTDPPTIGITPELKKFIDKTMNETMEEDPR